MAAWARCALPALRLLMIRWMPDGRVGTRRLAPAYARGRIRPWTPNKEAVVPSSSGIGGEWPQTSTAGATVSITEWSRSSGGFGPQLTSFCEQ